MERVIIASGSGDLAKGQAMSRNYDPDDPTIYSRRTFWGWFKGWPLRVVLALLAFFVFAVVVTVVHQQFF